MKLATMSTTLDQQYHLTFMRVVMKKWYKVLHADDEDIAHDRPMGRRKLEGNGVSITSNLLNPLFQELSIWASATAHRNGRVENSLQSIYQNPTPGDILGFLPSSVT